MLRFLAVALVGAITLAAQAQPTVTVEDAFPGARFVKPVGVEVTPATPGRAYVVEQGGPEAEALPRIVTLPFGGAAPTVYLDLSDRVTAFGEAGLLGLAFHPDYAQNGRVFVHYTAPVQRPQRGVRVFVSRVSEFARSSGDPLRADPASERVLLEVDQPAENHNGGAVFFGTDGLFYIALGDGGSANDEFGNGQNLLTLLGALLRIDVDDVPEGQPYGIPDDNPFAFVDNAQPEIYAYGLRNPWKVAVTSGGEIWAGDVGQGRWEEVDRVVSGGNYGWPEVEGPVCLRPGCDLTAFAAPVHSYGRSEGASITGGFVVEGGGSLYDGAYLFGDFVSGRVWALPAGATDSELLLDRVPTASGGTRGLAVSSIDPDEDGAPLVSDYFVGQVFRLLLPVAEAVGPGPAAGALAVRPTGGTPFRRTTAVEVTAVPGEALRVDLVDALGRVLHVLYEGSAPPDALRLRIDGDDLAPGLYLVRAMTDRAVAQAPFVRAR